MNGNETFTSFTSAETPVDGMMLSAPPQVSKEMSLGQSRSSWLAAFGDVAVRGYDGPRRPAAESVWPYACILAIVQAVGSVPLRISRQAASGATGTKRLWGYKHLRAGVKKARKLSKTVEKARDGDIVESGPLVDLLEHPMPGLTQRDWVERVMGFLYVCGRVHILKVSENGGKPTQLAVIPGSATDPIKDKTQYGETVVGWKVKAPDGNFYGVPAELMITLTLFNPYDPDLGLAPHNPAKLSIAADYNASRHTASQFANGCTPGGIIKVPGAYSTEVDQQIRSGWQQRHAGADNAGRLAVLFGDANYQTIAQSMAEMGFPTVKQSSREETCAIYRVPASVAGFFGTAGDASAYVQAEQERFWQDTAGILIEKLAMALELGLVGLIEAGVEIWADLEDIPVYQRMKLTTMKVVDTLWPKGVALADISELYDLGIPDRPEHRIGYLPAGLVAATAISGPDNTGETPPPDGSDSVGQGRELRIADCGLRIGEKEEAKKQDAIADAIWRAWNTSITPLSRAMENMFRSHFAAQQRKVIAGLKEGIADGNPQSAIRNPQSKDPGTVSRVLFDVFSSRTAAGELQTRVRVFLADARELGLRQALAEAGLEGDALNAALRQMTADPRILEGLRSDQVRVSTLVNNRTREMLRAQLAEGLEGGEGIRELATRVQGVMQGRRAQAYSIARNSVAQANSHARYVGRQSYATHEIWVSSRGRGKRRPGHVSAETFYRQNPKPVGEPFVINGVQLRYPRDPAGPRGEIINCECIAVGRRLAADGGKGIADCGLRIADFQLEAVPALLLGQRTEGLLRQEEIPF